MKPPDPIESTKPAPIGLRRPRVKKSVKERAAIEVTREDRESFARAIAALTTT